MPRTPGYANFRGDTYVPRMPGVEESSGRCPAPVFAVRASGAPEALWPHRYRAVIALGRAGSVTAAPLPRGVWCEGAPGALRPHRFCAVIERGRAGNVTAAR